jgi:adenosine deaminase
MSTAGFSALPTADLHLHIEGTLEPQLAFELAARNGITLPYASVDDLEAHYRFENLQSFLDLYYSTMDVLRTEDDFAELTLAYLRRASAQGVRHAEVFFDPQAHVARGVPIEAVIDGIVAGFADAARGINAETGTDALRGAMTGGLILCFLRDRSVDDAQETLTAAMSRAELLLGVGLDSAEVGHPAAPFAPVYARARAAGLHAVAHAGEEGPPSSIWQALDVLHVERVDHGIRAIEDPQLVERLVESRIPLTVCPLSNLRLHAVPSLAEHPVARLADAGVIVTINSDDPAYFGGYMADNVAAIAAALSIGPQRIEQFARNSVDASFASQQRKRELQREIDDWSAAAVHSGSGGS